MTEPDPDGITYDPNKVIDRAYARLAESTKQNDQLVVAVEALQSENARLRDRLAERAPAAVDG